MHRRFVFWPMQADLFHEKKESLEKLTLFPLEQQIQDNLDQIIGLGLQKGHNCLL